MTLFEWLCVAGGLALHAGAIIYGVGRVLWDHERRIVRLETINGEGGFYADMGHSPI